MLLYNFEQPQYQDVLKGQLSAYTPKVLSPQQLAEAQEFKKSQEDGKNMDVCDVYGLEHLVRVFGAYISPGIPPRAFLVS